MKMNNIVIFSDKAVSRLIKSIQTSTFILAFASVYIFLSEKKKCELKKEIENLKKEVQELKKE